MSKQIFLFSSLIIVTVFASYANYSTSMEFSKSKSMEQKIALHGSLCESDLRSSDSPVEAEIIADCIKVVINDEDLGNINVEIVDENSNVIFYDFMNASMQREFRIDISNWEKGSYSISFYQTADQQLSGIFDIY